MAELPPPRDHGSRTYSLVLVCLGNICRSPMAHVVLQHKLAEADMSARVAVASSGTGEWHVGEGMDRRAAATLARHGYDPTRHRTQQFIADSFAAHDAILVMDSRNLRDVLRLATDAADRERVQMFRAFDPLAEDDLEVPDPWFGGQEGFEEVLAIVERTTGVLMQELQDVQPDRCAAPSS